MTHLRFQSSSHFEESNEFVQWASDTEEEELVSGPESETHPQGAHFSLLVKEFKEHDNSSDLSATNYKD